MALILIRGKHKADKPTAIKDFIPILPKSGLATIIKTALTSDELKYWVENKNAIHQDLMKMTDRKEEEYLVNLSTEADHMVFGVKIGEFLKKYELLSLIIPKLLSPERISEDDEEPEGIVFEFRNILGFYKSDEWLTVASRFLTMSQEFVKIPRSLKKT